MNVSWWTYLDVIVPRDDVDIRSIVKEQYDLTLAITEITSTEPQTDGVIADQEDFFDDDGGPQVKSHEQTVRSKKSTIWCNWIPRSENSRPGSKQDMDGDFSSEIECSSDATSHHIDKENVSIATDGDYSYSEAGDIDYKELERAENRQKSTIVNHMFEKENEGPRTPPMNKAPWEAQNDTLRTVPELDSAIPSETALEFQEKPIRRPVFSRMQNPGNVYQEENLPSNSQRGGSLTKQTSPLPRGLVQSPAPRGIYRFTDSLDREFNGFKQGSSKPQTNRPAAFVGDSPPSGYREEKVAWQGKTSRMIDKKKKYGGCC